MRSLQVTHKNLALLLFALSFPVYLFFAPSINAIDLWGDETEILALVQSSFQDVALNAFRLHIGAPPSSYWIAWIWDFVLQRTPPAYTELIARLPSMLIHALAAALFGLLSVSALPGASTYLRIFSGVSAWATYFFNPILFAYAIEVKFYVITALGSVVVLYLYAYKNLLALGTMPLVISFCLGSLFHYILLLPYVFAAILRKTTRLSSFAMLFSMAVLYFAMKSQLLFSYGPTETSTKELLIASLLNFKELLFIKNAQLFMYIAICIALLFRTGKKGAWFIGLICFYIITVSFLQLLVKYFDFHPRHFMFTVPTVLFLLFHFQATLPSRMIKYYLCIILLAFTIPWTLTTHAQVTDGNLFSKDNPKLKPFFSHASQNNKIILLVEGSAADLDVNSFYMRNFLYYQSLWGVPLVKNVPSAEACRLYTDTNKFVFFDFHKNIDPC